MKDRIAGYLILSFFFLWVSTSCNSVEEETDAPIEVGMIDPLLVENGIHVATGFIAEGDYMTVVANCTSCHSSKLVLQNRATKEGWEEMIRWMQQTQKLWDLGENEEKILNYLATHYGPEDKGRRAPLAVEEWYEIE
ncbi:MAG: monoheme cytochrome C [Bacteroidota bacterium]